MRALALLVSSIPTLALAGGSPTQVLVLHTPGDPAVALHYAEARSVPPSHLCPIDADPEPSMSLADFETVVEPALDACLAALPHPEDIAYLVLGPSFPWRVDLPDGGYRTSFDAMLQVAGGDRVGQAQVRVDGTPAPSVPNPVYQSLSAGEGLYELPHPGAVWYTGGARLINMPTLPAAFDASAAPNLRVVARLDGFDADDARALVDRAVAADGTFPSETLLCMGAADEARAPRDPECEYVTRHLSLAGFDAEYLAVHDPGLSGRVLSAYLTGAANLRDAIDGNEFAPGAMACNLTSFGAVPQNFECDGETCPSNEQQTSIARFVRAGATIVHGTAAEPLNSCFPNAGALVLYTHGYSAGESLLFSQRFLYWQNVVLGDPLTTPWATRPIVDLVVVDGEVLASATHERGIAALEVFVNGTRALAVEATTEPASVPVSPGDRVLAVATAENAAIAHEGWPFETILPRPSVTGWSTLAVPEEPPEPEPEPPVEDAAPVVEEPEPQVEPAPDIGHAGDSGCGISTRLVPAGRSVPTLLLLSLLLYQLSGVRTPRAVAVSTASS